MNKGLNVLIAVFFISVINLCNAQNKPLSQFVPDGYVLFEDYNGDLNNDDLEDCILIIKNTKKENIVTNQFNAEVDRNRRGIMVLLRNENNYEVVVQNLNCFSSENEDGGVYMPPELSIDIENEKLKIHYSHGRYGYWQYTFKYDKNDFKLIAFESSENHGPVVQQRTTIDFLTGKKLIAKNTSENTEAGDEVFKENWSTIDTDNLIKLSEIENFDKLDMSEFQAE